MVDEYTRECLTVDVARQYRSEQRSEADRRFRLYIAR
jgi:hypothetical protein